MKHPGTSKKTDEHRFLIDEIPDCDSRGLTIEHAGLELKLLLVRQKNRIYCYRNRCPHMGVNLDWVEHQFLDNSGELIQCATHGALFRIDSGDCISGPCYGQKLVSVKVEMGEDDFLILP